MNEEILKSIKLRPNMANVDDNLLNDMIGDAINDVKDYINYKENEDIPNSLKGVVKNIVIVKVNRIGYEGVSSHSFSGVSTSFVDTLSKDDIRKLKRYRRLPIYGDSE